MRTTLVGQAPHPSYAELAAQVAELREVVRQLQTEHARLRAELAHGQAGEVPDAPAAPASVPPSVRRAPPRWAKATVSALAAERPPRKRRTPVPGRRREQPDRRLVPAPQHCPACQTPRRRGRGVPRRQVIDLPRSRVPVIDLPRSRVPVSEQVVLERRCHRCGTRCRGQLPDLSAQVGQHRRVSWRITARAALLRTKLRLPLAQLQWLLRQVWGLRLSVGELCALVQEAATAGQRTYAGLLDEVRSSPVAHVDETGWREDGHNGFVWTITTARTQRLHVVTSRTGTVIRELLGPAYAGVTVSAFSTAYDQLDGRHQRCWAHFLPDMHDLSQAQPADAVRTRWATAVHDLYQRAVRWAAGAHARRPAEREAARLTFERDLLAACREPDVLAGPARSLCHRVERYHPEFVTFGAVPEAPPTNTAAERALRPLVVARKSSGGTRSEDGTTTRMVVPSLVTTWERRGEDPYAALLAVLHAPSEPVSKLVPV